MKRISPSFINELLPNEIFVFGSNLSGIHGAGAARTAMRWGARYGQASGLQGKTYAIPTVKKGITGAMKVEDIKPYVDTFIEFAKQQYGLNFLVTEIGCGLAGLTVVEIAPLFKEALDIDNIYLPERFINHLIN